ncbi:MAG: hypothetical protein RIB60_06060 [Phycisphaerales bacterium]
MALDTTADNLMREVEAAEGAVETYLRDLPDRVQRYLGPSVDIPGLDGIANHSDDLTSGHTRQAITLMMPQSVQRAPVVRGTSRRGPEFDIIAQAVAAALTSLGRQEQDEIGLRHLWLDYYFSFGVARVYMDEREDGHLVPAYEQLPVETVFWDQRARSPRIGSREGPRFAGHRATIDHEDLIEIAQADNEDPDDEGFGEWDMDAVRSMEPLNDPGAKRNRNHPERNEVEVYEVWIPEIRLDNAPGPDEGYNGTLYTLAKGSGKEGTKGAAGIELRAPRPFRGPKEGPYVFALCWPVPGTMFPMSPQQASDHDEQMLDAHLSSASRAMLEYKRLILVPKGMGQRYKGLPDGFVIEVAGLDPKTYKPITIELGGITPQHIEHLAIMRDHLARSSGLDSTQAGLAQQDVTATASAIADSVTDVRTGFIRDQFAAFVRELKRRQAWYLVHEQGAYVGFDDPELPGITGFFGGDEGPEGVDGEAVHAPGETVDLFEALEIELETGSMERPGQSLRLARVMQANQFIISALPAVRQFPEADWAAIFGTLANEMSLPELQEPVNLQLAYQLAGLQGVEPKEYQPPRLLSDTLAGARAGLEAPRTTGGPRGPQQGQAAAQEAGAQPVQLG